jgi:hypothetical protein
LSNVPLTLKAPTKDYSEIPQTLGEHLRRRRRSFFRTEAGEGMGVSAEAVAGWEKGKTRPVPAQF